jgi:hypothetical protein
VDKVSTVAIFTGHVDSYVSSVIIFACHVDFLSGHSSCFCMSCGFS